MSRRITLYFDFVSPYSYLALTRAARFAGEHDVAWEPRPILYAAILGATGLVGPAEQPVKRAYTVRDIVRSADRLGVPLAGVPAHPFNSLSALRAACAFQDAPDGLSLATRIAELGWGLGGDLEDPTVLARAYRDTGLDPTAIEDRIAAPEVKARLRENTDRAIAEGVFGIPAFVWEGELFWGHDRLDHLADRLAGRLPSPERRGAAIEARPRGAERPGSPWPGQDVDPGRAGTVDAKRPGSAGRG